MLKVRHGRITLKGFSVVSMGRCAGGPKKAVVGGCVRASSLPHPCTDMFSW